MSQMMTEAVFAELAKVPAPALDWLDALVEEHPLSRQLSPALCDWLRVSLFTERHRRAGIDVDHVPLDLARLTNAELVGALGLSFALSETALDPLAEQFLIVLHKASISEVARRLLDLTTKVN